MSQPYQFQPQHSGLTRLSGDLASQLMALGLYGAVSLQGTSYSILNPATFRTAIGAAASSHSHPITDLTGLGTGVASALAIAVGSVGGPVVKGGDIGAATGTSISTPSGNFAINPWTGVTTFNSSQAIGPNVGGFISDSTRGFVFAPWANNVVNGWDAGVFRDGVNALRVAATYNGTPGNLLVGSLSCSNVTASGTITGATYQINNGGAIVGSGVASFAIGDSNDTVVYGAAINYFSNPVVFRGSISNDSGNVIINDNLDVTTSATSVANIATGKVLEIGTSLTNKMRIGGLDGTPNYGLFIQNSNASYPLLLQPANGRVVVGGTADDGTNMVQVNGNIAVTGTSKTIQVSGIGAVSSGDRYTIYATDTTYNRSIGFYAAEDGGLQGIKATARIAVKPGLSFALYPSGQTTVSSDQAVVAGEYQWTTYNSSMAFVSGSTSVVPVKIRGLSGQVQNLFECQTSIPTTVFGVTPTGNCVPTGLTVADNTVAAMGFGSAGSISLFTANSVNWSYRLNATSMDLASTVIQKWHPTASLSTADVSLSRQGVSTLQVGNGGTNSSGNLVAYQLTATYLNVAGSGSVIFSTGGNIQANGDGGFFLQNSSNTPRVTVSAAGNVTVLGTLGFSQSRLQQSAAQTLQTQCFDTSLAAWQETTRSQASPTGAKWSVFGATPILKQTLPTAATDAATTQTLCNAIRSLLLNFGFSN